MSTPSLVPQHIAIIMDGNRRWAKKHNLPIIAGHKKGAETLRKLIEHSAKIGVNHLSVYAFSSENWNRPFYEVTGVMALFKAYLKMEVPNLHKNNVKLKFIGSKSKLSPSILKLMEDAEKLTENNTSISFYPVLNYGSWEELTEGVRILASKVQNNALDPAQITDTIIADSLFTKGIPNPDLLIRTGGEQRLSNFLLLQLAYAEFIFSDILWPDYGIPDFDKAIETYQKRDRRFGT